MTTAEKKYADIINMARPEFEEIQVRYPRQPLSERAKIFSPFAALRGHEERLSGEDEKLLLVEKKELPEEDEERLSGEISDLKKGAAVTITIFSTVDEEQGLGRYLDVTGTVKEVEPAYGRICLNVRKEDGGISEETISIGDICQVNREENFNG